MIIIILSALYYSFVSTMLHMNFSSSELSSLHALSYSLSVTLDAFLQQYALKKYCEPH